MYLLAHTLFAHRLTGKWYLSKLLGALACVAVGLVGLFVPALVLGGALIMVLVAVIAAGYLAPVQSAKRGESPNRA